MVRKEEVEQGIVARIKILIPKQALQAATSHEVPIRSLHINLVASGL